MNINTTSRLWALFNFMCLLVWFVYLFFPLNILRMIVSLGVGSSVFYTYAIYKGMYVVK